MVFKTAAIAAILDFQSARFLLFFHLHVNLLNIVSFNLIHLVVCEMWETEFQDGGYGGHLGFPIDIDTILAQLNPVVLSLRHKFQLKSTKGLGRDVENGFSRWRLWRPYWIFYQDSFSYFVSTRHPDAPHQVSSQLDLSLQRRCLKYEFSTFSYINV